MKWLPVTVLAVSFVDEALAFYLPTPRALFWSHFSSQSVFGFRPTLNRTGLQARMTMPPLVHDDALADQPTVCVKRCRGHEDWTPESTLEYSGLLIPRALSAGAAGDILSIEEIVESVARRLHAWEETLVGARIPILQSVDCKANALEQSKADAHQAVIVKKIGEVLSESLPANVVELIMDDMSSICAAMARVVGDKSNGFEIKIELIGENACKKWHFDYFTARSIVTYCGASGTTFCNSPAICLEEVRRLDAAGRRIPSAESAQVGDILFIKGAKFAGNRCVKGARSCRRG